MQILRHGETTKVEPGTTNIIRKLQTWNSISHGPWIRPWTPPCTATAAKFERPKYTRPNEEELTRQLQQLKVSLSIFDRSAKERIPLRGNHPTLGLIVEPHSDLKRAVVVTQIMSGTSSAKIPRWRSRHRNSVMQEVDGEQVTTPQDLHDLIRAARLARKETIEVTFGRPRLSAMTSDGIPQLHFDQLNVIAFPYTHLTLPTTPYVYTSVALVSL